jgi:hypothetical protein
VELAALDSCVGIRDSKAPETGHLAVDHVALAGLLSSIKAGQLDI